MHEQQNEITNYQRIAKLLAKHHVHRLFTPDCLSMLSELNLKKNLKILDVGCRSGRLLFTLASFLQDSEDLFLKRLEFAKDNSWEKRIAHLLNIVQN